MVSDSSVSIIQRGIEKPTNARLGAAQVHGRRPAGTVDERAGGLDDVEDRGGDVGSRDGTNDGASELDDTRKSVRLWD